MANEWDKTQALKRGAQFSFISINEEVGEGRFQIEPSHSATPDKAFEQTWALTLLESVLGQLKKEYAGAEKSELFAALQSYLSGDKGTVPYVEMAARLNLKEGALKMSVLRLRRRFGELLRNEIAHTVASAEEIDEEMLLEIELDGETLLLILDDGELVNGARDIRATESLVAPPS
jgi:RNA polymerase sigma-70 factor (ECF subfamily)